MMFIGRRKILYPLVCLLFYFCFTAEAQHNKKITGKIQDTLGVALPGSLIKLNSALDTLATAADIDGNFSFSQVKDSIVNISVNFMGFQPFKKTYHLSKGIQQIQLKPIQLIESSNLLNEVVVVAVNPVILKEDTVEYDARAYPVREGDAVDAVIKKLPGVEVDKNGNITAQGDPITKIRLNGKDYFGDDVATAIQNLPADIIKNLQIIDDYGDQANVTGLKTGTPQKVLNINLQPDKEKGYFTKTTAGAGTEDRYVGSIKANFLNGDQQIAANGSLNNIQGGSAGISSHKSIKLNYRDKWNDKLVSYGSYRFNHNTNQTLESVASQNIYQDFTRFEDQQNNNNNKNYSHRLSWNFEYRPNELNYLKIEPDLSFEKNNSLNTGFTTTQLQQTSSERISSQDQYRDAFNFGTRVFYNHKFNKSGRNLSLHAVLNSSSGGQDQEVKNDYENIDSLGNRSYENQYQLGENQNSNFRNSLRASYIEPVTEKSFIEVNYEWSRTLTGNDRRTLDVNPVSGEEVLNQNLSNLYDYQFTTNRAGISYRVKHEKLNYILGFAAQPSVLNGTDKSRNINTHKETFNFIPTARVVYKFSKEQNFSANYQGSAQQPGFVQLQPITDNSNLQNTITGNPNLKPEFVHQMKLEYKKSNIKRGRTMFANIGYNCVEDKIVSAKTIIPDSLRQETTYMNTDGFYNARAVYSFSFPLLKKLFMTYYGGSNLSNNIAFTNNERHVGKNLSVRQGVKFRIDIEDIVDTEVNASYTHNKTSYGNTNLVNRNTNQLNIGIEGRNYFFKDLVLGYDFSQTINQGFGTGISNPTLLSFYLEHRFLKENRGSLRLQGFDLLNQNTGVSRDVFDNEIIDRQSNRLTTYFLLSFNFRLQQFGGS
ncbi:outer membrane beta-barrel protein [Pseudopedobacter sp.]|uniref:outer membrane beta-barrel protein n=1 Tax=Pseudopedobacter sp. TaxID=1936787 RepID=UPI0033411CD0